MYKYCCFFWLSNEVGDLLLILRFQFFVFGGSFVVTLTCAFSLDFFSEFHISVAPRLLPVLWLLYCTWNSAIIEMSFFLLHNTAPTRKKTQIVFCLFWVHFTLLYNSIHHLEGERQNKTVEKQCSFGFIHQNKFCCIIIKKKFTKIADTHGRSEIRFRLQRKVYSGNSLRGIFKCILYRVKQPVILLNF